MDALSEWRRLKEPPACPRCGDGTLTISDLSARPHTEWYRFQCAHCDLNETIALAQNASGPAGIN